MPVSSFSLRLQRAALVNTIWLLAGPANVMAPVVAQQAGTIGSTTSTTVSRQLLTTDSTTTVNNLSQSLIVNASGVSITGLEPSLVQSSVQSYMLATPDGSIATQLRTTELNPNVSFGPANPGGDLQLSITNELPGIKSVTTSLTTSTTDTSISSFSVYTAPLSQ